MAEQIRQRACAYGTLLTLHYLNGKVIESVTMNKMKTRTSFLLVLTCCAIGACSWAPLHDIRPRADYITAGVQVGDKVEIETKGGEKFIFEVTEVSASAVVGEKEQVAFSDIAKIGKRSWSEPTHPCGGGQPVGCSIPEVVLVLSEAYADQVEKFHSACVTHDFCYRHGLATYGTGREKCDKIFYEDMKKECDGPGMLDVLDVTNYGICQVAARQTFEAVRRYGEDAYRTTTSTVCDYR